MVAAIASVAVELNDLTQLLERIDRQQRRILDRLSNHSDQLDHIASRLARVERAVTTNTVNDIITRRLIMSAVDDLVTEVTEISDATTAVEAAVDGLLDRIDEVNNDPRVADAVNELRGLKTRLVSAALEGTEVAPTGPTDEGPVEPTTPDV